MNKYKPTSYIDTGIYTNYIQYIYVCVKCKHVIYIIYMIQVRKGEIEMYEMRARLGSYLHIAGPSNTSVLTHK